MVDAFLEAGFNYFDTAHGYLEEKSEPALKACLTSRYPRDRYVLTDKLTSNYFQSEADIRPFFDWNADYYYNVVHTAPGRKASDCIKCGKCEQVCPQHLPIRQLLEDVAKEFESA